VLLWWPTLRELSSDPKTYGLYPNYEEGKRWAYGKLEGGGEVKESIKHIERWNSCDGPLRHSSQNPLQNLGLTDSKEKKEGRNKGAHRYGTLGLFCGVLEKCQQGLWESAASLSIPVVSMSAGGGVDGQVLVSDMFGMTYNSTSFLETLDCEDIGKAVSEPMRSIRAVVPVIAGNTKIASINILSYFLLETLRSIGFFNVSCIINPASRSE
jgi:hypothetical protein